jgi:transposase-like protein
MRRPDPSVDTREDDARAECPYCGSTDTEREHPKGPSLCRSMHFCNDCGEPFEKFG